MEQPDGVEYKQNRFHQKRHRKSQNKTNNVSGRANRLPQRSVQKVMLLTSAKIKGQWLPCEQVDL